MGNRLSGARATPGQRALALAQLRGGPLHLRQQDLAVRGMGKVKLLEADHIAIPHLPDAIVGVGGQRGAAGGDRGDEAGGAEGGEHLDVSL